MLSISEKDPTSQKRAPRKASKEKNSKERWKKKRKGSSEDKETRKLF